MKTLSRPLSWLLLATLVGGCSSVSLTREDRLAIETVYLESAPGLEEPIEYGGGILEGYDPFPPVLYHLPGLRELVVLYALTPPGLWQTSSAYDRMSEAFTARMEARDIHVARICRDALLRRMRKLEVFPRVAIRPAGHGGSALSPGQTRIELSVRAGVAAPRWAFTPGVRPWIEVEGTLLDHGGRVLWRQSADVSHYDEAVPNEDGQKLYDNPARFEQAVRIAAARAIRDLVEKFRAP